MFFGRIISPYIAFGIFAALVVGCGKVKLPYLDLEKLQQAYPEPFKNVNPMLGFCKDAEAELAAFPKSTVQEYAGLRQVVAKLNPELQKDMPAAHSAALERTVKQTIDLLRRRGKHREGLALRKRFIKQIKDRASNPPAESELTGEIKKFVHETMALPEGNPCTNAFLSAFMDQFLAQLDPFSRFELASQARQLPENTLGMSPRKGGLGEISPIEKNDFKDQGGVLVVSLRDWGDPDELEESLKELETRQTESRLGALVMDLRGAGGADPAVLEAVRKSGRGRWMQAPMTVFVDGATRGVANGWLAELKGMPQVRVLGSAPMTFGYGRRICGVSQALDDPSVQVQVRQIAVSCEKLAVPQGIGPDRADGYRIAPDQWDAAMSLERVVDWTRSSYEELQKQRQPAQDSPASELPAATPQAQPVALPVPAVQDLSPASYDGGYDGDLVAQPQPLQPQMIQMPQTFELQAPAGLPADAPARTF